MPAELSQQDIKDVLDYDPETGIFWWRRARRPFPGKEAGSILPIGYRVINIHNTLYYAHRLAWLYMTGEWPPHQVDHLNGEKADNRFANLRLATNRQNHCNRGANRKTRSGVKNVHWTGGIRPWSVLIQLHGRQHRFGRFKTIQEATEVAARARKQLHGEFAPTQAAVKLLG